LLGGANTFVSKRPFATAAPPLPVKVAEKEPFACAPPTVPGSSSVTLQLCFVPVWTKSIDRSGGADQGAAVRSRAARVRPGSAVGAPRAGVLKRA